MSKDLSQVENEPGKPMWKNLPAGVSEKALPEVRVSLAIQETAGRSCVHSKRRKGKITRDRSTR